MSSSVARENRRKKLRQSSKTSISNVLPALSSQSIPAPKSKTKKLDVRSRDHIDTLKSKSFETDENGKLSVITDSFTNCDISSQPVAKVYLEGDRGFREINASQIFQLSCADLKVQSHENSPIFQALRISKYFHTLSNFCHGLLGGISFLYLLVLLHLFSNLLIKEDTVRYFSFFSKPAHNVFNFLCIICCVSVFDRLDISNLEGFFKLIKRLDFKLIAFIIYPICLILSLSTANVDDKFITLEKNLTSTAYLIFKEDSEIFYWKTLSISKCFAGLLGWIVICLDQNFNRCIDHLRSILHGKRNASVEF